MNWIDAHSELPEQRGVYMVYRPRKNWNPLCPSIFENKVWHHYCNQEMIMDGVEWWLSLELPPHWGNSEI